MLFAVYLIVTGFVVGLFSGLLGVGGGIVMVPALTFIPPWFAFTAFGIHQATGLSAIQCLVGGVSGMLTHARQGSVQVRLLLPFMLGALLGGFSGGYASAWIQPFWIYGLFGVMLASMVIVGLVLHTPPEKQPSETMTLPSVWVGLAVGGFIGFIAANTGVGGSAMLMPILIYGYQIPTRLAIGTGAGFVVFTSLAAGIGKLMVGHVPFPEVLWILPSAWAGGVLGARWSRQLPTIFLRRLLLAVMILALLRVIQEMYVLGLPKP